MNVLKPFRVFPFPTDYVLYKGIAYDGCFFYLTMPKCCRIYKYNLDFLEEDIIEVNKPYSCICYDNTANCFWTSVDKINTLIYKLDRNMNEIDCIKLERCNRIHTRIVGLSFNCEKNSLLAAFTGFMAEISLEGEVQYLQILHNGCYNAVLSIAPYYIASMLEGKTQMISIYTPEGFLIQTLQLPKNYIVEDILFFPCEKKERKVTLFILARKYCCYSHLLQCSIDVPGVELYSCNYEYCCPTRPVKKSNDQSVTDVIESIAMMETALSHILNALGEKLQKSCQISENICDLLEINKAVNKTVMNITQLEHILYAKLDTISNLSSNNCCESSNICTDLPPNIDNEDYLK